MSQTSTMNSFNASEHSLSSLSFVALMAAIALFVTSLFLPVFITQSHDINGLWVLAMGWLGFIAFQFAWYATPFAVLAVYISRKSPQLGLFLSIVALVMASGAFLFTEIPFGKNDKVLDYGMGFYLWYLCFYLVSFSILLRLVIWGSIVEDTPVMKPHTQKKSKRKVSVKNKVNKAGHEQSPLIPAKATIKAKRKVIPSRKEVSITAQESQSKIRKWMIPTPPPLPRKNIYQKLKIKKTVAATPPPLKVKKKKFFQPPPLPKMARKKRVNMPPPLPKKEPKTKPERESALRIAPFF